MKTAWFVSFIRIPLLLVVAGIFYLILKLFQLDGISLFLPDLATVYFTTVNLICLFLLSRILRAEGRKIKDLIGFHPERLGKDILFGFLWLLVLYLPFVLAVAGTMFLLFGPEFASHFKEVFVGDAAGSYSRPIWLLWTAAVISLLFPFLNAPIEELMYRGYAQPMFISEYGKAWFGIIIPAIGFALQHAVLAPNMQGAVVYIVAFFVWGIGSGMIYYQQKRLFPLIVAHFLVNMAFSILPIMLLMFGDFNA